LFKYNLEVREKVILHTGEVIVGDYSNGDTSHAHDNYDDMMIIETIILILIMMMFFLNLQQDK